MFEYVILNIHSIKKRSFLTDTIQQISLRHCVTIFAIRCLHLEKSLNLVAPLLEETVHNEAESVERNLYQACQADCPKLPAQTRQAQPFEPYKGKIRKSGTGGIYELNDHLFEGRYSPTNAYGKREVHTVYAKTREECERLLDEMINGFRLGVRLTAESLQETE